MSNTQTSPSVAAQSQNPATQKQHMFTVSHSVMNTKAFPSDADSLYAQSTTSSKASLSSRFGSLAKLPLLTRSKYSAAGSSRTSSSSSSSQRSSTPLNTSGSKSRPRNPVKSVPSGKPPVANFADLAYRYGTSVPQSGRL